VYLCKTEVRLVVGEISVLFIEFVDVYAGWCFAGGVEEKWLTLFMEVCIIMVCNLRYGGGGREIYLRALHFGQVSEWSGVLGRTTH